MNNSTIVVHQAFYGENNRAHSCLQSTIPDSHIRSFLTAFTDRPSALTAGVELSPYYSGTGYKDYYIITRTMSDTEASRGGMVFTHALIISQRDLAKLNDLNLIFGLLLDHKPDTSIVLQPINVASENVFNKPLQEVLPQYIQKAVKYLINTAEPVIFSGDLQSFAETIRRIWAGLPISLRSAFSFTAGFNPTTMDKTKRMIYVQPDMVRSFSSFSVVDGNEKVAASELSDVERFILNTGNQNNFEAFVNELGIVITNWSDLATIVKAFNLYAKRPASLSADECRLLIRLLGKIAPIPLQGVQIKHQVIHRAMVLLESGEDSNFRAMKNLDLNAFDGAAVNVAAIFNQKLIAFFSGKASVPDDVVKELFVSLNARSAEEWWLNGVDKALQACGSLKNQKAAATFWRLLILSESPVVAICNKIPAGLDTEDLLLSEIPANMNAENALSIIQAIYARKWYRLSANLRSMVKDAKSAVTEQLLYEEKMGSVDFPGTALLSSKLTDADLLAIALKSNNKIVIKEYAVRTVPNSQLLKPIKINQPAWLEIWSQSLTITRSFAYGLDQPKDRALEMLDALVDGIRIPANIITLWADSAYNDIGEYSNRAMVWPLLPDSQRQKVLASTVKGYVASIVEGKTPPVQPEQEIAAYVSLPSFLSTFFYEQRSRISSVLSLYNHVADLPDRYLADYIRNYSAKITDTEATGLGRLIVAQHLSLSARQVFEKSKQIYGFRTALAQCSQLVTLSFWERMFNGHLIGEPVTEQNVYQEFGKLANRLYDKGPEDRDLWKRSGGDNSKLPSSGSRAESWQHAIHLLEKGSGGKDLTVKKLVKEMLEDFPNHSELKEFKNYFK